MSELVIIEEYNPLWPELFEAIRRTVAPALDGLAASIDHVGSTAVPGLAAKPIIDIDVLLRSEADLPLVIRGLAALGYQHRGDLGVKGRESFHAPDRKVRHHLYVCPPHSAEYRRHITFRDFLRCHPDEARRYGALKRELASQFGLDREGYNQAKTQFVKSILELYAENRESVG
jgi:GrpB-like predicted nucleotidyltransferase (UPF0157 family)